MTTDHPGPVRLTPRAFVFVAPDTSPSGRTDSIVTGPVRVSVDAVTTDDGVRLVYRRYEPEDATPRGTVLASHGIQSHGGWYRRSSARLAAAGWRVVWPDRRGSGWSGSGSGDATRLLDDLALIASSERIAGRPLVPLGISWGAKPATAFAIGRRADGLILVTPGLFSRFAPSPLARLAIGTLPKKKTFPIPLSDPALFTDDPAFRAMIAADPHARRRVDVATLRAAAELDRIAAERAGSLSCPVLIRFAGRDAIVDNRRTRDWAATLGTSDLTVQESPRARHTVEFEPDRDAITDRVIAWLDERFGD